MISAFQKILKKVLGDKSSKDLALVMPVVNAVNTARRNYTSLSADGLREKVNGLRAKISESLREYDSQIEATKQEAEALPHTELEQKERLFADVDRLMTESNQAIEKVLEEILPEAFALVVETASRFKENEVIEVIATDHDRNLSAASRDYVEIRGE
ncbi:MAG: preprotein translocase subunit SecA, partial [Flavobacteriales bacterium]